MKADNMSLGQAMLRSFNAWFFGNGRFYPGLIVEKYLVFYAFTNLIAYKSFLIAMTLATVELFRRCVAAYATLGIANLCALIVVTLFAERGYHDSILAYNAMPQVVMVLMLLSLMAFRRALVERNSAMHVASAASYLLAALTYEDVYPLCLLYAAIPVLARKKGAEVVRMAAPYVIIAATLAVFALAMRQAVRLPEGSLYAFGTDPMSALRTGVDQVVAAFPLSYWLFDPSGIYGRSDLQDFLRNAPLSPALFIAFAAVAWFCLRVARRESHNIAPLVWIGAMALVLPALPIAATIKYQHELKLGLGYLPVFFEVFGVALIAGALTKLVMQRFPSVKIEVLLCIAISICGTMTQATNVRLVREGFRSRAARTALEQQLAHGLVAQVHDGEAIGVSQDFDWIAYDDDGPDGISTRGLFALYADRRIILVPVHSSRAHFVLVYDRSQNLWTMTSLRML